MKKKISLNINFDSLADCLKLVCGSPIDSTKTDPCFFQVMDRFLKLSSEYGAKYTLFMVGQDLENPRHAEAVAKWHDLGHEIANHSYSHRHDLSRLSYDEIKDEISRAEEVLRRITNKQTQGFTSPGWHSSDQITRVLKDLGYRYDASLGPTWLFQVAQSVLWLKSPAARGMVSFLRQDFVGNMIGSRRPYCPSVDNYLRATPKISECNHLMIPLPTTPVLRLGLWHTLSFSLPDWFFTGILNSSLKSSDYFYYLMHPSDLIDASVDLDGFSSKLQGIHRMMVPYQEKEAKLRKVLEALALAGEFVTMSQLCDSWYELNSTKNVPTVSHEK